MLHGMHATARPTREDIDLQRTYDEKRAVSWPIWDARVDAVKDALWACEVLSEEGAHYALRQSLVDLASCCEVLAEPMAAPTKPYPR